MVTSRHEAAHRIFQERQNLLTPVFRILGVDLPEPARVEVIDGDATEIRPLERRVDSVLRLTSRDGEKLLLAIESQSRQDPDKANSWAYYVSYLKAKYRIPTLLLVVCRDKKTADWAAGPFHLGTNGWTSLRLNPLVLGPGNVPVITDPAVAAENLPLAAFSALTHGDAPEAPDILDAMASALRSETAASVDYYSQFLEIGLGDTRAREIWRKMMKIYFPGRGLEIEERYLEGKAEGEAAGREEAAQRLARTVLRVLESRDVRLPEEAQERIRTCSDLDEVELWAFRMIHATTAEELFAPTER
ncbi:RpnC/YadD family protein [Streptomyces mayteni]